MQTEIEWQVYRGEKVVWRCTSMAGVRRYLKGMAVDGLTADDFEIFRAKTTTTYERVELKETD